MKITTAVAREMPTPVPAVPGHEGAGVAEAVSGSTAGTGVEPVVVMGRV
ncbi:hypothetical protein [Pseudonocardia parietis]|uniref:Zn-dependent alcohol dehydrogenase n=1 Tax=Pseudonocardia parietis TaxID=570936 RepID=A0ABS4VX36_9PSEU|nr:hypothetical protein [Pseudonocardia parietis]MBP2368477.1 Zn-dependent alcohol dehydrogenase [Pseudonocardia parietis]